MKTLLINDHLYQPLASESYYEIEVERILLSLNHSIFPGYRAVAFKDLVYNDSQAARPDYALISENYQDWWVVEVELSHHCLSGHVIPQVTTLIQGAYNASHAKSLCRKHPLLDETKMLALMKGTPPHVLVVVDREVPGWVTPLEARGARLLVFEVFRSEHGRYAYHIEGFQPNASKWKFSRCRLEKLLPMFLRIDSPAFLTDLQDKLDIYFEGRLTSWSRIETGSDVWLKSEDTNPLQQRIEYEIRRYENEMLEILPTVSRRR